MLYFAYGSNLEKVGMRGRCPAAEPIGSAALPNHRRVFRHWADVEPAERSDVAGGLWRITPDCLLALDDYEEVGAALYRRVLLDVRTGDKTVEAFVYRMVSMELAPPAPDYLATILKGCRDFGLDEAPVRAAGGACLN